MFHKKQIFKLSTLKKLLTDEYSCVSLVSTSRLITLPPFFLNDMKSGVLYILNASLKKYDRSLGGIVIGYQNIKVLMDENTGIIPIGTSETEVNISVEFYIFQPKIGSYLEGVVNKKSNTHIGCLVHQYFNATILKPEDIDYDDWICQDFSVDDRVKFKVKDLDFTTLLPYIEGVVEDANAPKKVTKREKINPDNETPNHDITKSSDSESFLSETLFSKTEKTNFSNLKKAKNQNEEEISVAEENLNTSSEFKSFTSPKKKKKKKEKNAVDVEDVNKKEKMSLVQSEKNSEYQVLPSVSSNNESRLEERHPKKKKKKKSLDGDGGDSVAAVKPSAKEEEPASTFLEKFVKLEDENSSAFEMEPKSKKVKKKKKSKEKDERQSSDFIQTNACLPVEEVEDNMFYSTQLESISKPKKMKLPFFSPIPMDTGVEETTNNQTTMKKLDFSMRLNTDGETEEKEKKKKHKKRKREEKEESAVGPSPKKIKTSHPSKEKPAKAEVNGIDVNSATRIMMEEMCQKLLNEAKEKLNVSGNDGPKVKKKKKDPRKKEKEKKAMHDERLKASKSTTTRVNGTLENSEVQSILDRLLEDEIRRVNEEMNESKKEKIKSNGTRKSEKEEKKRPKEKSKSGSAKVKSRTEKSLNDSSWQQRSLTPLERFLTIKSRKS